MKHILPILTAILLTLLLAACSIQMGYPTDSVDTTTKAPDANLKNSVVTTNKTPNSFNAPETSEQPVVTTTAATTESTHPYKDETVEVTHPATVVNKDDTFTGDPPLADVTYTVVDPQNKLGLSTDLISHSYGVAKDGKPNQITVDNQARFDSYHSGALTWDNKTEEKVLYLTFDCGYEYEDLTSRMLDTLKAKNVPATFFCTMDYLEQAPTIVARMIEEGHIVGNHSTSHPSDCSKLTREEMAWEVLGIVNYLRTNFGYDCKYFRFPAGNYSECALDLVYSLGCRSVFWSVAHVDWDPADQPGVSVAYNTLISRLHPGAVILLHSTSPDNAAVLGDFIDYARSQGYEFRSLDQYEYWEQ